MIETTEAPVLAPAENTPEGQAPPPVEVEGAGATSQPAAPAERTSAEVMREILSGRTPDVAYAPDEDEPDAEVPSSEPTVDANGRLRGPDGKFLPQPSEEPEAQDTADTAAATPDVPAGFVRIELPEDHPLRERGKDSILAPEAEADEYKGLAGSYARRREVEQATEYAKQVENRALQLEREVMQAKANYDALSEAWEQALQSPALLQQIQEVREYQGEEAAARMIRGIKAELSEKGNARLQEIQQQFVQQQVEHTATEFLGTALRAGQQRYPQWSEQEFRQALAVYGSHADATRVQKLDLNEFFDFADVIYVRKPEVQQALRSAMEQRQQQEAAARQAEIEAARNAAIEEAKAAEAARLADAAKRRATNPWDRMAGSAVQTGRAIDPAPKLPSSADFFKSLNI